MGGTTCGWVSLRDSRLMQILFHYLENLIYLCCIRGIAATAETLSRILTIQYFWPLSLEPKNVERIWGRQSGGMMRLIKVGPSSDGGDPIQISLLVLPNSYLGALLYTSHWVFLSWGRLELLGRGGVGGGLGLG